VTEPAVALWAAGLSLHADIVGFSPIGVDNNSGLAAVAPGIAKGLFAAVIGLVAAIPAVVAYNKITVDLGRLAGRMQGRIGRCGTLLSGGSREI
jgi:biopolymer transport protein TolQ